MRFPGDGARGTRTPDLLGAIQALSQLSYSPEGQRAIVASGASPRRTVHLIRTPIECLRAHLAVLGDPPAELARLGLEALVERAAARS
jgi:hypothetical protein